LAAAHDPASPEYSAVLASRLAILERRCYRATFIAWASACLVCVLLLFALSLLLTVAIKGRRDTSQDVLAVKAIFAKQLSVTGENGSVSGLWASEAGEPCLSLFDVSHRSRIHLSLGSDGDSYVALGDHDGHARARISVAMDGPKSHNGITFFGLDGKRRLDVGIDPNEQPAIRLNDKDGLSDISVHVSMEGIPEFRLSSPDHASGVRLQVTNGLESPLRIFSRGRDHQVPLKPWSVRIRGTPDSHMGVG
jgi:hypothetical protein